MCAQTASAMPSVHMPSPPAKARFSVRRSCQAALANLGFAVLLSLGQSGAALAATAPPLGTTSTFGIVSDTFTNNANPTNVNGAACYTTAPVLPPTTIAGAIVTPCNTQIADQATALAALDSQLGTCVTLGAAVDLSSAVVGGGTPGVIPPGCYSSSGAMSIGSTVTLSGSGVYIFRPGAGVSAAALSTAADSVVNLVNACATDVYWAPVSATTLGANSTFVGTIIDAAGITLGHTAVLTGRALAAGGTVTTDANTITVPGTCSPVMPTVTVTKVSNGAVNTFGFTGSNGFANQSITTLTSGTGVAAALQPLTAAGVITTITESAPPAGYALTSISCTGVGSGAATPDLVARTVTLNAAATAAGAAIACTFTNTYTPVLPTATVTKVSNGAVNTFGFTGSNGFANQSITTLTSGTGVAAALQPLTAAGVITTITESAPPAGYALTSISCTGLGTGGAATPNLGTRTVTLDAAATAAGSAIACTFTNTFMGPVPPSVESIPTLSEWAMIMLVALMAFAGISTLRRQRG